jgi:hypothetical protein
MMADSGVFHLFHISNVSFIASCRYDYFLMHFMYIFKERPPTLPALDVLGIEPIDQISCLWCDARFCHLPNSLFFIPRTLSI